MELYNGDCLDVMKNLKENSVDIIIADLPYGRFKHLDWDKKINLERMWKEIWRIAKPTTPIFLFGDFKFGVELINTEHKNFRFEIVWNKLITTTPLLSRKRPGKATEYIFCFSKKQSIYNIDKYHKKINNPIQESRVEKGIKRELNENKIMIYDKYNGKGGKQWNPSLPLNVVKSPLITGSDKEMYHAKSAVYNPTLPINILECKAKRLKKVIKNITEKPQFLLEYLLKYWSNENDVCLDFVMGSGSCGEACKNLNRKFIGIELNKEHFEIAQKRLMN